VTHGTYSVGSYSAFLERKTQLDGADGFDPVWIPEFLFDFQSGLVEWAIRQGRAALFADCGLGKTPMQLVWAQNVHQQTGRPVIVVAPLAVSFQVEAEAAKFGIEAEVSERSSTSKAGGAPCATSRALSNPSTGSAVR
jgi:hypothetical protein